MTLAAGSRLGPYEVLAPLGAGGMGEVYRARDSRLGREVAIKVLPADLSADAGRLKRFEKEARAASALSHPNIVTIYEVGSQDGVSYIAMELVAGKTLRDLLLGGAVPMKRLLQVAAPLAEGLAAAHEAGIVHRDLKPENVMVSKDGLVKILDFGLAKLAAGVGSGEGSLATVSRTEPGGLLGTVSYMSPEQAAGQPADFRSDQFSIGTILYEMTAGKKAFHRETAVDTLSAILHEEPEAISAYRSECPAPLVWVIERCLAKDPAHRYDSTRDLARDLANLRQRTSSATGAGLTVGQRAARLGFRIALPWVLAALGFLVAGGFAFVQLRPRPAPLRPVRFSFPLPESGQLVTGTGFVEWANLAVSPDGRSIAFVAMAEEQPRIWIRPVNALSARVLPGTEGAISPFWSPDGESLAFFAGGSLKRIALAGGLAQVLCAVSGEMASGSWNALETILFAQGGMFERELKAIPALGGAVALVSGSGGWRNYGGYRWPHFLPDGRRFLCLAWSGKDQKSLLISGELGSSEVHPVAELGSRVEFAPPGHLFYVREGTLLVRPFDAAGLRFTGEGVPLAEGVPYFVGTGWAPFSVSRSGVLAYQAGSMAAPLRWLDRRGQQVGAAGPAGHYAGLCLSHDGRRVAVQKYDGTRGPPTLWVEEFSRNVLTRLTSAGWLEHSPVWSPDGTEIVFAVPDEIRIKRVDDPGPGEILTMKQSGSNRTPLDWSSDGKFLLYTQFDPNTRGDLWILPFSGDRQSSPFRETEFDEGQGGAAFSPDGRWVAFLSDESGRYEAYVAPYRGSGQRVISAGGAALEPPRWRSDGKELFYVSADRDVMSVALRVGPSGLEPEVPVALFRVGSCFGSCYDVTTDGQRFLTTSGELLPITVALDWAGEVSQINR